MLFLCFNNLTMKHFRYYFLLFCLAVITNSCEEAGISFPASGEVQSGVFEVTFDSQIFSTSNVEYTSDNSEIIIAVNNLDTKEIFTLRVDGTSAGTYDLIGFESHASYINNSNPNASDVWSTTSSTVKAGEITISAIDDVNNTISGTFIFSGINLLTGDVKQFTKGSFTNIPKGTGTTPTASNNKFTAKVDGVLYETISVFGTATTVLGTADLILVTGNKSFTEVMTLYFDGDVVPGEYDLGSPFAQTYPSGTYALNNTNLNIGDGKVIVTIHDTATKRIAGTFEFEASPLTSSTPNYSITEGSFDVTYQ